jgi:hypothetical protein
MDIQNYRRHMDIQNYRRHRDIQNYRRRRDISLKTKVKFCSRCFFAVQIIINTIYMLYYIYVLIF